MDKAERCTYAVEPFQCDGSGCISMPSMGTVLLNAADVHSTKRGYGMGLLDTFGRAWVISRLAVEMGEAPREQAEIAVETWVESVSKLFTTRCFSISDTRTGKQYGYARGIWAMIDKHTRRPVDLVAGTGGVVTRFVDGERLCPIAPPSRVNVPKEAQPCGEYTAKYSDIDMNGHVNSLKYVAHALDLWDSEWHSRHRVARMDMAYSSECKCGDRLVFAADDTAEGLRTLRITRGGEDGCAAEACRCAFRYVDR